jgi:hypothetical protein
MLMRRIDELFTARPFLGSRRLMVLLRARGVFDQPQARAPSDAADGDFGTRSQAEDDKAGAGAQDLPLPGDRPAEPGLGRRRHLHPDWARLFVSGGNHRLGEPGGVELAVVERGPLRRWGPRRRCWSRIIANTAPRCLLSAIAP